WCRYTKYGDWAQGPDTKTNSDGNFVLTCAENPELQPDYIKVGYDPAGQWLYEGKYGELEFGFGEGKSGELEFGKWLVKSGKFEFRPGEFDVVIGEQSKK